MLECGWNDAQQHLCTKVLCSQGLLDIVLLLVEGGANVSACNQWYVGYVSRGLTPSSSALLKLRAQHLIGPRLSRRGLTPLAEMSIQTDLKLFFNIYKILASRLACMHPLFLSGRSDRTEVGHDLHSPSIAHANATKPRQMNESLIQTLLKTHKDAKTKLRQLCYAVTKRETVNPPPTDSFARRWTICCATSTTRLGQKPRMSLR